MSTPDFFRARLDEMIDLRHPLAVLATRMPWSQIESSLAPLFVRDRRERGMRLEAAGRGWMSSWRAGCRRGGSVSCAAPS